VQCIGMHAQSLFVVLLLCMCVHTCFSIVHVVIVIVVAVVEVVGKQEVKKVE
jgi:hypothetical protein